MRLHWDYQIRSYILQPYTLVKDLRTGVETSDIRGVLNGDLDAFLKAALAQKVENDRQARAYGRVIAATMD
jgi:peptide chain release factor 2